MRDTKFLIRMVSAVLTLVLVLSLMMPALAASYPYDTISMDDVNMRKSASTSAVVLRKIKAGDTVTVLGKSGAYYKVKFDGKTGYAMCVYIDGLDPSPDPSPDPGMVLNPPPAISTYPYDTTVAGWVKMRKTAKADAEVIRTLMPGDSVTVYDVDVNGFAKIKNQNKTGYVVAGYLNLADIPLPTPTPAPTVKPEAQKYITVGMGDRGSSVQSLQEALIELGYLAEGSADGKFGTKTEAAVKLMEKRNGLTQDGIADQELQYLLYEDKPKNKDGYRKVIKTLAPVGTPYIRVDSKGEPVERAQKRLKELGYYAGDLTAVNDKNTQASIKNFEAKHGLMQDGELDPADQNVLYGATALSASAVVTPAPTATPEPPIATIRQGDKSEDVKKVQERLKELGYYPGSVDGSYGAASVKAMQAFQKANGLEDDGVYGLKTRAVLFAPHPVYAVPTAPPVSNGNVAVDGSTGYPVITKENVVIIQAGSRGDMVLQLQKRLQELGYYSSRMDGVCLSEDITAIRNFQKANGLKVDGKAGYDTQTKLYSSSAVRGNVTVTTSKTLYYGDEGPEVTTLQNRLIALGYLVGTADGKFGSKTRAALIEFQRANGLVRDGIAGTKTLAALDSSNVQSNKITSSTSLKMGSTSDAVADLQRRLIALGYLTGKADGIFGTKTSLALISFQKANGLTADGVAGTKTIAKLNKTNVVSASGQKTETTIAGAPQVSTGGISAASVRYANWYDEIRAKARMYPNATVYDFTTGISWQVNMFSTGAHADSEPITAQDTANMNRAFGGKTTWTPKAVWVVFSDGTVYLASTHNTPHEVYHIKNNDFPGHLCIHFPRTQKQVESIGPYATSHQKAIDQGWEATLQRAGK